LTRVWRFIKTGKAHHDILQRVIERKKIMRYLPSWRFAGKLLLALIICGAIELWFQNGIGKALDISAVLILVYDEYWKNKKKP
jgi:hypothetical protein